MQQLQWMFINQLSEHRQPQNSFMYRCLPRDNCCIMIEQLLTLPEVYVLAVGSRSCLQFMHSPVYGKPQGRRLLYIPQSLEGCVDSSHLEAVEKAVCLAVQRGAKGVILYLCCADVLIGTDFTHLCSRLERETGILVRPLYRGIVATRRKTALSSMMDIVQELFTAAAQDKLPEGRCVALLSKRKLAAESDLFKLLQHNGYQAVTNHCETAEEFAALARCAAAISLDSFGDGLAEWLQRCSGTQTLRAHAHFDLEMIERQLKQLSDALGFEIDRKPQLERLQKALHSALAQPANASIAVGCESGNFELAAGLLSLQLHVDAVFCNTLGPEDQRWIDYIAVHNPHLQVCFNSRINEKAAMPQLEKISTAIGTKAGFFCKAARRIPMAEESAFGYEKLISLLEVMA
ncbi:MAG TPA: nitrogenase component 1 [Clostridia bacterium]|nr:nitrogenase component 1 [Clostridia bacterium]